MCKRFVAFVWAKVFTDLKGKVFIDLKGSNNDNRKKEWNFSLQNQNRCHFKKPAMLYLEWINNEVLLCSAGNYIQYPIINHNGKEYEKGYLFYICMI